MDPTKRELREQKRLLKREGSKHRRRAWKEALRDHPDDPDIQPEDFGKCSTRGLNGIDRDATRKLP
jgi:hypothetical protein